MASEQACFCVALRDPSRVAVALRVADYSSPPPPLPSVLLVSLAVLVPSRSYEFYKRDAPILNEEIGKKCQTHAHLKPLCTQHGKSRFYSMTTLYVMHPLSPIS